MRVGTHSKRPDGAALADDARLLRFHTAGLVKAVVEIREQASAVAHGAMDLVDDAARIRPLRLLRCDEFARPEPHGEEIEKWTPYSMKMPPLISGFQNQWAGESGVSPA